MKKRLVLLMAGLLVVSSISGAMAFADENTTDERPSISEEMKEQVNDVKERIKTLKEEGKTREEIADILKEEGLVMGFHHNFANSDRKFARGNFSNLSERLEGFKGNSGHMVEKLRTVKPEGHEYVTKFFDGDITIDELREALTGKVDDIDAFMEKISSKLAIREFVDTLDEGLSREEIREMIKEKFPESFIK